MRKKGFLLLFVSIIAVLFLSHPSYASQNKDVNIKHYHVDATTYKRLNFTSIPNSETEIYYYRKSDGRKVSVKTVYSDDKGNINNVKINIPDDVNRIYFNHILRDKTGSAIVDENGKTVSMVSSKGINGNTIDSNELRIFGSMTKANKFYSYVRCWDIYNDMLQDMKDATSFTAKELKAKQGKTVEPFEEKKVIIKYKENDKSKGLAGTYNNDFGDIKKGDFVLQLFLPMYDNPTDQNKMDERMKVYVAHEYAHYTMFQAIAREGMTSHGYKTHSSYNKYPQVSYKEGWGLFHANRYPYRLNMNGNLDVVVQGKDKDILYGKSTNRTVYSVFRDIYDLDNRIEKRDDMYNIARDNFGRNYSTEQIEQLSNGLMFFAMRDSKATTLEEYVKYLKENYVHDTHEFNKILRLNGLTEDGKFTLDENGNPL